MHPWGHFKTITRHKLLVMRYCFRVGLIRQGLLHDLSKYSWTEFRVGMKYYAGDHSPNAVERDAIGYSTAWLHHKGRNKHHLEYWMDYDFTTGSPRMAGQPMPTKYMVELCLDRIAACRIYQGEKYTDRSPLEYLNKSRDASLMHPITKAQVTELLTMLAQRGEAETLRYMRQLVLAHPEKIIPNLPEVHDPSEKDHTFIGGESAIALAEQLKTPFYLYDQATIEENCASLRQAFSWNAGHRQFFPVKATPTPAILRLLRENGEGVVCSAAAELELCRRCGFLPEEIMFMPNYPSEADLDAAGALGCRVMLDGPGLVDAFAARGMLRDGIGLRLNPGGIFRFGSTEVQLDSVKFGFSPQDAEDCVRELQSRGIASVGIHSYLAGNTLSPDYWPAAAELLLEQAKDLMKKTGAKISYVNLSGGLGIPYKPGDKPLDMILLGDRVRQVFETQTAGTALAGIPVYTEVGRWITGPAGVLVTSVAHVRRSFRSVAGVDASASDLMRPMMYGAYHHISVAGQEGVKERHPWDVVGSVCENTDKFAWNRMLPDLKQGDVLLIHDSGAHGHSMGYQYGGRLRCGEYLLTSSGVKMIRRAETPEDYFAAMCFDP